MSTNLYLNAKRQIIVVETGKEYTQVKSFGLGQTPTKITRAVLASDKPEEVYIKWVRGLMAWGHGRGNHINALQEWLASLAAEGWTPVWSEL